MILGGTVPTAVSTTEIIDLGASNPAWVYGPDMSAPRVEMDAVLLPNGKVLAVGGSGSDEVLGTATLNADIFDPAAAPPNNVFKSAGSYSYARVYHTVALLMPDATVWLAGGNPQRGTYEQHMEIYSPAYLFNSDGSLATRPTITSAPTNITWNTQFAVSTPDAANIGSAVLMRPGSSTHAFDMSERMVGLNFTAGSGMLTVTGPPSANVAPPGYYMLFLLNNSGVPSVAKFVLLNSSANPAPTVSSISPVSGTTAGGTPVTITGTGFLAGATVKLGGTSATGVSVSNSTTITATAPAHAAGAVSVVVTNTDNQSGTLTNGYTYTNPAPTVSAISPVSGTTAGGTPVTITGTGFLTGATVKLGGTSATGVSVTNSTTITATTAAHAAGAVDVVVTNTDAQSGTLSQGYTYTTPVNPAPTVSSISPVSGTTAGGTPVTITGTGFLAGATVSFGGTPATGVGVTNSTTITATTPAHAAGAVNVVVTNTDAQSGTLNNGYTYTTSGGGGTIAFVQSNSGPATIQASNTTVAVTYAVAQTAGDTNIVVIGWGDTSSTISSVTDNKLNSYALAVGPTSGTGLRQSIYYAPNIAGGSTTVTVTFNKAAAYPDVRILEYSGLDPTAPLDKAVGAAGTGTAANSGSVSTTAASELIFGAGTSGTKFTAAGSGFTSRMINLYGNIAEDKTVNATGSYNATATDSFGSLGDAGGNVPRRRTGSAPASSSDFDLASVGNDGGRDAGHDHRYRLCGRRHGDLRWDSRPPG